MSFYFYLLLSFGAFTVIMCAFGWFVAKLWLNTQQDDVPEQAASREDSGRHSSPNDKH
jgi:hypothetical protein